MPKISGNKFVVELGKLLQHRREALGMTREELAERAGIRYDVIQMYEEGQRTMKIDRLFEILNALDISVADCMAVIFGRTGTI